MTAARHAPVMPRNWRLFVGPREVDRAGSRNAAMGLARWWIRRRRGRIVQVRHQATGEKWEWRGTTWVPVVAGKEGGSDVRGRMPGDRRQPVRRG